MFYRLFLTIILLACFNSVCLKSAAFAAKPYRCDGKVQFRPCDFKFTGRDGSSMVKLNPAQNQVQTVRLTVTPLELERISGYKNNLPEAKFFASDQNPTSRAEIKSQIKKAAFSNQAQILTPRMKRLPKARGLWEGVVKGVGEISLNLLIFRNGALESSRFMGRVILDRPKSTTFAFNSALPKGQGWEWSIVADSAA